MFVYFSRRYWAGLFTLLLITPFSVIAEGGGIALNSTRIIYPLEATQLTVTVRNTSEKSTYLVQSWVENSKGDKSRDFFVTPPLYASAPKNENMLRLMLNHKTLAADRESLYYFNTKAIPSVDKAQLAEKNALLLAAVTRIKLFVRPAGLKPSPDAASAELRFQRKGERLNIINPTPYYLTLTDLKIGDKKLSGVMVSPKSETLINLPTGSNKITFSTINDYGAVTPARQFTFD